MAVIGILWPAPAYAWGPTAHLDFGIQILRGTFLIAPAVRALCEAFPADYLYGCLAADIIVGKNRAEYDVHCHSWQSGLRLLDAARGDHRRALAYGFLSHLAADTVAHNYFVPYKLVESFRARTTRHTYWELRYERVIHDDPQVWETFAKIRRGRFREHDGFLDTNLPGASRLFSFGASRRIFRASMALMGTSGFRGFVRGFAHRSALPLTGEEAAEYRALALDGVASFLTHGPESPVLVADPVGRRSLRAARAMRAVLRQMAAGKRLELDRLPEVLPLVRVGFRASLRGAHALALPDVEEALHRASRPRPKRERRPSWAVPAGPG